MLGMHGNLSYLFIDIGSSDSRAFHRKLNLVAQSKTLLNRLEPMREKLKICD